MRSALPVLLITVSALLAQPLLAQNAKTVELPKEPGLYAILTPTSEP